MQLSARLLVLMMVVVGLGFVGWNLALRSPYSPWYTARFERVSDQLERLEFVSADGVNLLLYRLDPANFSFRLEHSVQPERVTSWSDKFSDANIVINGFYFLENFLPAGLMIVNGAAIHDRKFDFDKSGIIRLDPDFDIVDTEQENFEAIGVLAAGQSYPFIFKHGLPAIKLDSGLLARRTFIGTDTHGQVYIGVVWKDDVSLFELMQILDDLEIAWSEVINLDGGPSTGIAVQTENFNEVFDSAVPVPNVIVVQAK